MERLAYLSFMLRELRQRKRSSINPMLERLLQFSVILDILLSFAPKHCYSIVHSKLCYLSVLYNIIACQKYGFQIKTFENVLP